MQQVIYDIECLKNCFVIVFYEYKTDTFRDFEINIFKNEHRELTNYCKKLKTGVGFNNLHYDYPLLHEVITRKKIEPEQIYTISQDIINGVNKKFYYDPIFNQRDLFKIWHYDNKSRSCSWVLLSER